MAGLSVNWSFVLSIFICFILIVCTSATAHTRNVMCKAVDVANKRHTFSKFLSLSLVVAWD